MPIIHNYYVRKQIISDGEAREGRPRVAATRLADDVHEALQDLARKDGAKSLSSFINEILTDVVRLRQATDVDK